MLAYFSLKEALLKRSYWQEMVKVTIVKVQHFSPGTKERPAKNLQKLNYQHLGT